MQRLLVRLIEGFGERRHEAPPCGAAAELGEIDDASERLAGDQTAEGGAHLGGDRHVGVAAAEHDDRIAGNSTIGACAQAPPDPERIHDSHPRTGHQEALDKAFRRVRLA